MRKYRCIYSVSPGLAVNQHFLANVDISQNVGFSIRHTHQLPPEHENLKPQIESERDRFRESHCLR